MRFVPGTTGSNGIQYGGGGGLPAWQTCQQVYYTAAGGAYDNLARSGQDGRAVFGEATIHSPTHST